jgi:hypothetical protein
MYIAEPESIIKKYIGYVVFVVSILGDGRLMETRLDCGVLIAVHPLCHTSTD